MLRRLLRALGCALLTALLMWTFVPRAGIAQTVPIATIKGSLIDQTGLPISGARVDLYTGTGARLATVQTTSVGTFAFPLTVTGIYHLVVSAEGYQSAQSADIVAAPGTDTDVRIGLIRSTSSDVKTIGRVSTNELGSSALQSSATIAHSLDAQTLVHEGAIGLVQGLSSLPGVITNANSSQGNDASVKIRGSKTTEVGLLIDGHPIGPLGAQSDGGVNDPWDNGPNLMATPLFAFNNVQVTYGSGADGLFGTSVLGGVIDLQTLNPTSMPVTKFSQGVGSQGQSLSVLSTSGILDGKLGYVFLHSVQGQSGNIPPETLQHRAGLGNFDFTSANVNSSNITYANSQNFLTHSDLGKLTYQFNPNTSLLFSYFDATAWSDSTGNGDNKIDTYDYQFFKISNAYKTKIGNCQRL